MPEKCALNIWHTSFFIQKKVNMAIPKLIINQLQADLEALEKQFSLSFEGRSIKMRDCYFLGTDPLHVLFNTNCPDDLREEINALIAKYISYENRSSE